MNPAHISDSFAAVGLAPSGCPYCGAKLSVNGGDCLRCLLETGLAPEQAEDSDEGSLEELLADIDVRDSDWQLGNYHILEEIGRGGMGVIYRARQRHSKRIVALKRVLGYHGDSRETLERFRREAEAAASLDHPNILPIYEVGEADGLPFFTMKLATGGSLQGAAAGLSASPRDCVLLLAKVARAVAYAHREGILHRDLKPGNILLDWRGEPMVSDFGLAKWIDTNSDLTRSLAVFGTPGFVAPEQARGPAAALTPAADIYSLGAILFELLSGRPPFLGDNAIAVIHQAGEKTAPKLRSIIRTADRDLETICAKCLEREPQARYRSAADLAEDLERWLEGRPIVARPVSPPATLWRWCRRNPVLAGATAACLIIAGVAVGRQFQSARFERQIAEQLAAKRSVQVLALLDLDTGRYDRSLADQLATQLRNNLAPLGPVDVKLAGDTLPASAANQQKEVAARTLLTGTIRTVGNRRRLSLHLLEATSLTPLLHEMVEVSGPPVESSSIRQVATALDAILNAADLQAVAKRPSDPGLLDPEARDFISAGLALAYRRGGLDFDRSIGCLSRAIELQPRSAAAHAAMAKALAFKAAYQSTREPLAKALAEATTAIELDPWNPEGHVARAAVFARRGQAHEAIDETLTAIELSPVSRRSAGLLVNIYKAGGRPDLALLWTDIADDGPRDALNGEAAKGDCHTLLLQDDRAEAAYAHYLALHPEHPEGWIGLCRLRLLQGKFDDARATYDRHWKRYGDFSYAAQMAAQVEFFARNFAEAERLYVELAQHDPNAGSMFYGAVSFASALGRIQLERDPAQASETLKAARLTELEALSQAPESPDALYRLAAIDASLGSRASALAYLERAAKAGWIDFRSLKVDPRFDALRDEAEYHKIIEAMEARVTAVRDGHIVRQTAD